MKIKNLWVSVICCDNFEKVVIVRECSMVKRIIKFIMKDIDDEYREVFTNKQLWLKKDNIEALAFFLDIEKAKPKMSHQELREFYKEKQEEIKLSLVKKTRRVVGFRS